MELGMVDLVQTVLFQYPNLYKNEEVTT